MNKKSLLAWAFIAVSSLAAFSASGESSEEQPTRHMELRDKPEVSKDQYRLNYRLGFNISATIKNLGTSGAQTYPPPPPPPNGPFVSATGVTYRDGYVGVDTSGNAGGVTWYWGYARSDQILGDTLLLSSSTSGTLFKDIDNAPQHGIELTYARRLGECNWCKWGLESGVNYMDLDFRSRAVADPRLLTVDAFSLGSPPIVPPLAPYAGSFNGPGPLINAKPTSYPVTVVSEFDPAVFGVKLGPYLEIPLTQRLAFNLSGGFALLFADGDFLVQQTVTIPGRGTATSRITKSDLAALPGGYVAGSLSWAVCDTVNLFTALQYQNAGRYSHNAGDKRAEIDFRNSLFLSFGFSHPF